MNAEAEVEFHTSSPTTCQVCGETKAKPAGKKDDIELVTCIECGTMRVAELDPQDYAAQYMSGWYQAEHMDTVVQKTNAERYEHDKEVGLLRLANISKFKERGTLLDIGCSNGAFVDAALDSGYDAYGCDLCDDAFESSKALAAGRLKVTEFAEFGFQRRMLDVIVMNDIVEHLIDPRKAFKQACGLLKRNGVLVVDVPDFGVPLKLNGLDYHHVKPREHIWYPSPIFLAKMLQECDFIILDIQHPVENKIVIYAQPNPETVMDVRVWGPTGLGDIHWVLLKMGALKKAEAPCTLRLTIPGYGDPALIFRSAGFLKLLTVLDSYDTAVDEPVIVDEGAKDCTVPNYRLIANGHIERGHRIEGWYPHLETDFHYEIKVPEKAQAWASLIREQAGRKMIIVYASSDQWNYNITGGKGWTAKEWMKLVTELNKEEIYPVLIGKPWDRSFASQLAAGTMVDIIGKTSEAQMLALFQASDAVIGLCAGSTILSVHIGAKSLVFWPLRGTLGANMEFHPGFQHDWVEPEAIANGTYVPLSLGKFDVDDVMEQLRKWDAL